MADALTPGRPNRERGSNGFAAVPTGERRIPIGSLDVVPQVGTRVLASVIDRMSGQAAQLFEQEYRKEASKVEAESKQAGLEYGLSTEAADLKQLPIGDTIAEKAFRSAALTAGALNVEMQVRQTVARLERDYEGNPIGFDKVLDKESTGYTSKLPPELATVATETYQRVGSAARLNLEKQQRANQIDQLGAQLMRDTEGLIVSTAQQARTGDYGNAMASLGILADALAASGPIAQGGTGVLTATQVERQIQNAKGTVRTEYMLGYLDRAGKTRGSLSSLKAGETGDPVADAIWSEMMPAEQDRIYSDLEIEVRRAETEWKSQERERMALEQMTLNQRVRDDEARLLSGNPSAGTLSPESFVSAYGPEKGALAYEEAAKALSFAATKGMLGTLTMAEQSALLAEQRPDPAAAGFADDLANYQSLTSAVEAERAALQSSPAGYVAARDPGVKAAWDRVGSGGQDALQQAVEVTMAEQERRGVPDYAVQPMPPTVMQGGVTAFSNADNPRDRISVISSLSAVGDQDTRRKILMQFENARGDSGGLPTGAMARVMDIYDADPDKGAKVLEYLMADTKGLKLPPSTDAAFRQAIYDAQTTGVQAVRARQQALTGNAGLASVQARDMAMIDQVGRALVAQNVDPAAAAIEAQSMIFGDLVTIDEGGWLGDGLGALILPASTPKPTLEAGLRVARERAASELAAGEGLVAGWQMDDYRAQIEARGVWVNSGSDLALIDSATGEPFGVALSQMSLEDALRLGEEQMATERASYAASPIGRAVEAGNAALSAIGNDPTLRSIVQGGASILGTLDTGAVTTPSGAR
jgi:hypothetical protein